METALMTASIIIDLAELAVTVWTTRRRCDPR